jgi:hypothetical protein
MEPIVFTDPLVFPNDELVFDTLGEKNLFWKKIYEYLAQKHPVIIGEWRYYKDGKSWLYRSLKKEKAIIWWAVYQNGFRVTSYVGNKAEVLVENSDLSAELKEKFAATKGEKFRPITIWVNNETAVDDVERLIEIKLKLK